MKAVLEIELLREDEYCLDKHLRPWVCRLTGLDEDYRFKREFLRLSQKDYSRANGKGSRGIYAYYVLDPGIYEVKRLRDWKHEERYFILVEGDVIKRISRAEVNTWLEQQAERERRTEEWLRDVG